MYNANYVLGFQLQDEGKTLDFTAKSGEGKKYSESERAELVTRILAKCQETGVTHISSYAFYFPCKNGLKAVKKKHKVKDIIAWLKKHGSDVHLNVKVPVWIDKKGGGKFPTSKIILSTDKDWKASDGAKPEQKFSFSL